MPYAEEVPNSDPSYNPYVTARLRMGPDPPDVLTHLPLRHDLSDERAIAVLQSRGLPPDLQDRLAYLTSRQREYLALRASGESVRDAAARLSVSDERLKQWYSQGGAYVECLRAIRVARSDAAVALARSITTMAAPVTAWRMTEAAQAEDATSRDTSHRQRARETVLEAAGVVSRAPLVQVTPVQAVLVDSATLRAELAAIHAEREALEALLAAHHATQSILPGEKPDTGQA